MTEVSIIIPSWNRKNDLKECLDSIKKQTFKNYEVIVVDNGSTDGTLELLNKKYSFVKVITNKKNVGAAQARNQAYQISKGKYLWFLDSDSIVLSKDCLKTMLKILKENPKIGQLGGEKITLGNETKIRISNSAINQDGTFLYLDNCKLRETDYIATSNCIMLKELLYKCRGFDPRYIYGYEDNDVGYEVSKLGYKNFVDDRCLVLHKRAIAGRVGTFYRWHKNRIRFLFLKKNILFIIFLPIIDIFITLKLLPNRIQETKKINLNEVVSLRKENAKKHSNLYKIVNLGFNYSFNWLLGYLWNIVFLPQTLYLKIRKPNYLK
ncbi:MAG: glycosyltransferase family 2 protein [Candidatus Nanoarchaeia archaeon]